MGTVVWINGPFGVGKTTVANALARYWPRACVFDPELVGTMLRGLMPPELQKEDYQDMPLWRRLVRATVLELSEEYDGPLIVPMTVVEPAYLEEIVGGLREAGTRVVHFTLLAREDAIRKRLAGRSDDNEWPAAQLPRCLAALTEERFTEHLATDARSADEVARVILERVALPVA